MNAHPFLLRSSTVHGFTSYPLLANAKKYVCILLCILCAQTASLGQERDTLQNILIPHPDTQDPLLSASGILCDTLASGHVRLRRPLNRYQMSFSFPTHGWKADFSQALWDTTRHTVLLFNPDSLAGYCLAEAPTREGLEVAGNSALLDLKTGSFTIRGIPGIRIANGWVVPTDAKQITLEGKKLPVLKNATLLLNAFSRYHKVTDAEIEISSRFAYTIRGGVFHYQNPEDGKTYRFEEYKHSSEVIKRYGSSVGIVTEIDVNVTANDALYLYNGNQFKGSLRFIDSSPTPSFYGKVRQPASKKWQKYRLKNW